MQQTRDEHAKFYTKCPKDNKEIICITKVNRIMLLCILNAQKNAFRVEISFDAANLTFLKLLYNSTGV